jgi:hypothetical protein
MWRMRARCGASTVRIARRFGKDGAEGGAIIVVADQQMHRQRQAVERGGKSPIGVRRAPVRQIAGVQHERRLPGPRRGVAGIDRRHCRLEPGERVEPVQGLARRDQVGVCHTNSCDL